MHTAPSTHERLPSRWRSLPLGSNRTRAPRRPHTISHGCRAAAHTPVASHRATDPPPARPCPSSPVGGVVPGAERCLGQTLRRARKLRILLAALLLALLATGLAPVTGGPRVSAAPYLLISSVQVTPTGLFNQFRVTVTVTNTGDAPTVFPSLLPVTWANAYGGALPVAFCFVPAGLQPGQRHQCSFVVLYPGMLGHPNILGIRVYPDMRFGPFSTPMSPYPVGSQPPLQPM